MGEEVKTSNLCELCGIPMPKGEESFRYHGYSCPCPVNLILKPEGSIDSEKEQLRLRAERAEAEVAKLKAQLDDVFKHL